MIERLIAAVRRALPVGSESDRVKWRSAMHEQRIASEREIERLHRIRHEHGPIEDAIFPLFERREDRP